MSRYAVMILRLSNFNVVVFLTRDKRSAEDPIYRWCDSHLQNLPKVLQIFEAAVAQFYTQTQSSSISYGCRGLTSSEQVKKFKPDDHRMH